ncbi:MAG: hypothetical protein UX49_C0005G0028 [Candidatus Wolfebacteria bacterium GW2011_GWC2_46_275]|nr:MAG: hypothetical protein UX70_C0001G0917 [Candidatus Wolfebacteria bacterium GW2011_GWB1_47_1]KKU36951.1 MAG: hypothetical protein UX49_C0005G0028 [Candidatus Wolfebacteria bacterium GW2011_GWC2_46_275]KKU42202.1 MAG: hypothetical protein UX58_C0003G0127 [Candidatus Wolfebacteria bacterium GW2011_GWB2_46_69]KKU59446.1 MAG: hypothetical protein UX83_C0005G0065 [Candidatus Wolfebacteria bacterium GW2011_GWE2_47_12]KKU65963.1 MAG: hypothetical protein UX90_C0001G0021 [Candidatus Wolfebacteria 
MPCIIWLVLCIFGAAICAIVYPYKDGTGAKAEFWATKKPRVKTCAKYMIFASFGTIFLSPVYYEFPGSDSTVVTFEGAKAIKHPFGAFCWEWSEYSNLPTGAINVSSGVTFLTENPKVRHLKYRVGSQISDPELFYRNKGRRIHSSEMDSNSGGADTRTFIHSSGYSVKNETQAIVASQLFEFNNRFSKQLAQLYNPLEANQQREFRSLIEPWLNAQLAKDGIAVVVGNFSIE